MEVIQWFTSGARKPGVPLNREKAAKHCLFRLDSLDTDILREAYPDTLRYIQNEVAKDRMENGGSGSFNKSLSLRVTEEDVEDYQMKCLEQFALLLGLIKPGETITDWIHKF